MRVVAVGPEDVWGRLQALVIDDSRTNRSPVLWWGGYAQERLGPEASAEAMIEREPGWRKYDLDLPNDWQEGHLSRNGDEVVFKRGDPSVGRS